jgi:hypothetical protein
MVTTGVSMPEGCESQCLSYEADPLSVFENVGQANDALGYNQFDKHYDRNDRFELVRAFCWNDLTRCDCMLMSLCFPGV